MGTSGPHLNDLPEWLFEPESTVMHTMSTFIGDYVCPLPGIAMQSETQLPQLESLCAT